MPDIAFPLTKTAGWHTFIQALAEHRLPHALAVVTAPEAFASCTVQMARLLLCREDRACGSCMGCLAWKGDTHPDLLCASPFDEAPGIDLCRKLAAEIGLRPVAANRRLGVFPLAENMSLPAANSLLKLTEEPPAHAALLLLAGEDRLLPTLRSRVWLLPMGAASLAAPIAPPPRDQWGAFFTETKNADATALLALASAWGLWFAERGEFGMQARLEMLGHVGERGRLSAGMLQDLLCLAVREEYPLEDVFDDLW